MGEAHEELMNLAAYHPQANEVSQRVLSVILIQDLIPEKYQNMDMRGMMDTLEQMNYYGRFADSVHCFKHSIQRVCSSYLSPEEYNAAEYYERKAFTLSPNNNWKIDPEKQNASRTKSDVPYPGRTIPGEIGDSPYVSNVQINEIGPARRYSVGSTLTDLF